MSSPAPTDVHTVIVNFCKEDQFKQYVRSAINNELFWREMLNAYNLDTKIENKVNPIISNAKTQMESTINNKIKSYKQQLPKDVENEVKRVLFDELNRQMPTYLNNHVTMNQILHNHSISLNTSLVQTATEVLFKLANEEQYQMMTTKVLENMEVRYKEAIATQIEKHDTNIKNVVEGVKSDVKNSMENFNNFNNSQRKLENKINTLEKQVNESKSGSTIVNCVLVLGLTIVACFALYRM